MGIIIDISHLLNSIYPVFICYTVDNMIFGSNFKVFFPYLALSFDSNYCMEGMSTHLKLKMTVYNSCRDGVG
jgi:hypothetical protein